MSERAIIEISGPDRIAFLQGLVTQDVALLESQPLLFAALLTPQGKLAHDFFLLALADTVLLDVARAHKDALLKRLAMYKLRAKVALRDAPEWHVAYVENGGRADPRHAALPQRLYTSEPPKTALTQDEYHARRYALGIPETPFDTTENDVAMDLGYDLLNAINFTKGCYVGQEVTARMHYKNIARRGFYVVEAPSSLPAAGAPLKAGEAMLGTLRGSKGALGLTLLKFEEVENAPHGGVGPTVENTPVTLRLAPWLAPKLAQFHAAEKNQ